MKAPAEILKQIAARMKWVELREKTVLFVNARSVREKKMIILFALALVAALDYLMAIYPVATVFMRVAPKLSEARIELSGLEDDDRNKEVIAKKWEQAKERLKETERMFIAPNEVPALLENLSKLALEADVKIISLRPIEVADPQKGPYRTIPIRIAGLAGTHELGSFLASLESGQTYFRVTDLKIKAYPADPRRQSVDLRLEGYRKED